MTDVEGDVPANVSALVDRAVVAGIIDRASELGRTVVFDGRPIKGHVLNEITDQPHMERVEVAVVELGREIDFAESGGQTEILPLIGGAKIVIGD